MTTKVLFSIKSICKFLFISCFISLSVSCSSSSTKKEDQKPLIKKPAPQTESIVQLEQLSTEQSLSAGNSFACWRQWDHRVKCWGNNTYGQLGIGDTTHRGDQPNEMGQNLPYLQDQIKILVTGNSHTCALLQKGNVKCWGNNHSTGNLG